VQATNGDLYRTTAYGGANANSSVPNGGGTVFRITPSGTLTTLYSFCAQSGCPNGTTPPLESSRLPNGDFYGVMESGGTETLNGQPHGICAVSGFR
jgi:uncharacterized repeat protein (TIGR03803 family)